MTNPDEYKLVSLSFSRCCLKKEFFDAFYDAFLATSPEVAVKFKNTDLSKQKIALRSGLTTMLLFVSGSATAKSKMDHIGIVHDKKHHDIRPDLYPLWINSLMATIKKFDVECTPDVEKAWQTYLNKGVEYLLSFYR